MSETKVDHLVNGVNPFDPTNFPTLPKEKGLRLVNQSCVRKTYTLSRTRFSYLEEILKENIFNQNEDIVKVFKYKIIKEEGNLISYFYDMKRLWKLYSEEYRIINSALDNLGTSWADSVPLIVLGKTKYPKLIAFLYRVSLSYNDLHAGNILKDRDGSYKLIDLEGFL